MSIKFPTPQFENKIVAFDDLEEAVKELPHPVVFTNGVFDILHRGHVTYLAQAASLGRSLVVAVNSDSSVKMLGKGDDRPINREEDRAAVIAALECVSMVVIFKEKTPVKAVEKVRPDFYVKGGDYRIEDLPEAPIVHSYGGKVITISFEHERSTTALLKKVRNQK
jgi:rfaE bifunctional protein nucleotidyltransferase chain/domain